MAWRWVKCTGEMSKCHHLNTVREYPVPQITISDALLQSLSVMVDDDLAYWIVLIPHGDIVRFGRRQQRHHQKDELFPECLSLCTFLYCTH